MGLLELPLFPLGTVLFPGEPLPLHVFEIRYRQLVQDLLDQADGPRRFGVVAIKEGREVGSDGVSALHEYGCTAELRRVQVYPDGRFDVLAMGVERFRVVDTSPGELLVGQVELLPEEPSVTSVGPARAVRRLFVDYRQRLLRAQGLDGADDDPGLPADPRELGYAVAAAMLLDLPDKQALLAAPTTAQRLAAEADLLRRELQLVGGLALRPAVELTRMPYAPN